MKVVNSEVEPGEQPVVNSRYSIVIATAKRARQLIDGAEPLVDMDFPKPLSIAVEELYDSKVKILPEDEITDDVTDVNNHANENSENNAQ
jgi:DNA-directed RNA polymerase subunit omega